MNKIFSIKKHILERNLKTMKLSMITPKTHLESIDNWDIKNDYKLKIYKDYVFPASGFILTVHEITLMNPTSQKNFVNQDILPTSNRPNLIVIISRSYKCISIFELTVPYERNISKVYDYKCHKYTHLVIDLNNCGFKVNFFAWKLDVEDSFLRIILKDSMLLTIPSKVLNYVHQILEQQ